MSKEKATNKFTGSGPVFLGDVKIGNMVTGGNQTINNYHNRTEMTIVNEKKTEVSPSLKLGSIFGGR